MKKQITDYRKEHILDKQFRYPEGIMTRKQWLNMWRIKGANVVERKVRNYAAEEKLEQWLYDNREDMSGNENWPPTKRYLEKKAELKAGIFKIEYTLNLPDNSLYDITKTEYDYFKSLELAEDINTQKNELNEKMEAGTATDEEINEAMDKEFEFAAKYFK